MDDTDKLIYEQLKELRKEVREGFEEINGRVRSVEAWKWRIQGGMMFLTVVVIPVVIKVFFWRI